MTDIRLIGETDDRRLYVARIATLSNWPQQLDEPVGPFVVFTAFETESSDLAVLGRFARTLLDQGCVYACAWGPGSGHVEFAFDLALVDAEIAGRPYNHDVGTTSHEDESLDDALWFAMFNAYPSDAVPRALLAVSEEAWAGEIESRLANVEPWTARVMEHEKRRVD